MNTYQIWIIEKNGKRHYYGKTPLASQAGAIKYQLEQKGYKVKLMKNGIWH